MDDKGGGGYKRWRRRGERGETDMGQGEEDGRTPLVWSPSGTLLDAGSYY